VRTENWRAVTPAWARTTGGPSRPRSRC
jgi:hypothetical protein